MVYVIFLLIHMNWILLLLLHKCPQLNPVLFVCSCQRKSRFRVSDSDYSVNLEQRERVDPDLLTRTHKHSAFHLFSACALEPPDECLASCFHPGQNAALLFGKCSFTQTHLTLNHVSLELTSLSTLLHCCMCRQIRGQVTFHPAIALPFRVLIRADPNLVIFLSLSLCRCEEGLVRSRAVVGKEEDLAAKDPLDAW